MLVETRAEPLTRDNPANHQERPQKNLLLGLLHLASTSQSLRRQTGEFCGWDGSLAHQEEVPVLRGTVLGRQFLDVALLDQLIGWVHDVFFPTQLLIHLQELVHFLLQETGSSGRCKVTKG